MISLRGQRWIAVVVPVALGCVPLLMYAPALEGHVEHAAAVVCPPAWLLALAIVGGAHSGYMDAFPLLCAIFTALTWLGAISLVFRWLNKRQAAHSTHAAAVVPVGKVDVTQELTYRPTLH